MAVNYKHFFVKSEVLDKIHLNEMSISDQKYGKIA